MSTANIESIYPLSALQEGILYHCMDGNAKAAYFVQYGCAYHDIDPQQLIAAWELMVKRHAALRTLFTWERRERPLQIVRQNISLPLYEQDWREASASERSRRWESFLERDRDRGFDLEKAPLFRLALFRITDNSYRLLWSFHHMLLDGWSMRLILNELGEAYTALTRSEQPLLPIVKPFSEFVAWLDNRQDASEATFWREAVGDFSSPNRLKAAHRHTQQGHRKSNRRLDRNVVDALSESAARQRLTFNTIVVAAWAIVVAQHSRIDDVVLGTTVSGRSIELNGIETMSGLFLNTLPLRVRIDGQAEVGEWLRRIQADQVAMRAYEQSPLTMVHKLSGVPAGVPLFESIVVFQNRSMAFAPGPGDLALRPSEEYFAETSHYPLALLAVQDEGLDLWLVHDSAWFSEATVAGLLEQVNVILESFARSLHTRVSDVPLLSARQLQQVTTQFNDTAADLGPARCVHESIDAHVRTRPAALAVVDAGGHIELSGARRASPEDGNPAH